MPLGRWRTRQFADKLPPRYIFACVRENGLVPPRWILTAAVLGSSTLVSAQIVECIDANGVKAFTQTCPNGTVKQREIEEPARASTKSGRSNDASNHPLKDEEKAFEQRREERQKAAAAVAEMERNAEEAARTCATDRRLLEVLGTGRPSKRVDSDTGEHVAMDENQRQAEIAKLTSQIQSLGDACR